MFNDKKKYSKAIILAVFSVTGILSLVLLLVIFANIQYQLKNRALRELVIKDGYKLNFDDDFIRLIFNSNNYEIEKDHLIYNIHIFYSMPGLDVTRVSKLDKSCMGGANDLNIQIGDASCSFIGPNIIQSNGQQLVLNKGYIHMEARKGRLFFGMAVIPSDGREISDEQIKSAIGLFRSIVALI